MQSKQRHKLTNVEMASICTNHPCVRTKCQTTGPHCANTHTQQAPIQTVSTQPLPNPNTLCSTPRSFQRYTANRDTSPPTSKEQGPTRCQPPPPTEPHCANIDTQQAPTKNPPPPTAPKLDHTMQHPTIPPTPPPPPPPTPSTPRHKPANAKV